MEVVKNTKSKRASKMSKTFEICVEEGGYEKILDSLIDFFLLLESYFVNTIYPVLVAIIQALERASHAILRDFKTSNPSTFRFLVNVKYISEVIFNDTSIGLQTIYFEDTTHLVTRLTARLSSYFIQVSQDIYPVHYYYHS